MFCGVCCTVPPTTIRHMPGRDATSVGPNVIVITSIRNAQIPATRKYHIGAVIDMLDEAYPAAK